MTDYIKLIKNIQSFLDNKDNKNNKEKILFSLLSSFMKIHKNIYINFSQINCFEKVLDYNYLVYLNCSNADIDYFPGYLNNFNLLDITGSL